VKEEFGIRLNLVLHVLEEAVWSKSERFSTRLMSELIGDFLNQLLCTGASQVALVVKNPPHNARDLRNSSSIPGSGRSPEEYMVAMPFSRGIFSSQGLPDCGQILYCLSQSIQ